MKRICIRLLKKADILTSVGIRLVKLTGKSQEAIHPKYLVTNQRFWYLKFLKKGDKVLDVGCGVGQQSLNCARIVKSVVGFDNNKKNIEIASKIAKERNFSNVKFSVCSAENKFPFLDNEFDKVMVFDVLEHLNNRSQALKEARRVLKNKGLLLLVIDNPDTSWKKLQRSQGLFYYADRDHKYEYPKDEIIKILKKHKFNILSIKPVTYDTPIKPFIDLIG